MSDQLWVKPNSATVQINRIELPGGSAICNAKKCSEDAEVIRTLVQMLGYVFAESYPKATVPDKLQEIADQLGRENPFVSGGVLNDLLAKGENNHATREQN